jgi:hypothetical protein
MDREVREPPKDLVGIELEPLLGDRIGTHVGKLAPRA